VGIVNHKAGAIFFAEFNDLGQIDDVAFHAEYAVNDNERAAAVFLGKQALEIRHVFVAETLDFAVGKAAAVNDACVVHLVDDDDVVLADEGGYDPEIDLKPVEKISAESRRMKRASFSSSSTWISRVPLRKREPAQPLPYFLIASTAASLTFGWLVSPR
jgi:hypothetical protein